MLVARCTEWAVEISSLIQAVFDPLKTTEAQGIALLSGERTEKTALPTQPALGSMRRSWHPLCNTDSNRVISLPETTRIISLSHSARF